MEKTTTGKIETTESLARHLGISRWTVSRVLNGHSGVKKETVERVLKAMEELEFSPSPMARGLRGVQTRLVGICFQELETSILVKKTVALQEALRCAGYQAIIELTQGSPDLEEKVVQSFQALKVDGIILVGSSLRSKGLVLRRLLEEGIPVVAIDPTGSPGIPGVSLDREKAYFLLGEHLLTRIEPEKLGIVGIDEEVIYGDQRLKGINRALSAAGLGSREKPVPYSEPGRKDLFYKYGYDMGERILRDRLLPEGLLCLNDEIALGVIRRLGEAGIEVPRDVLVTGFDNLDISKYSRPTLTTLDQQIAKLTEAALQLLIPWMEGGDRPRGHRRMVEPQLCVRESSGGK